MPPCDAAVFSETIVRQHSLVRRWRLGGAELFAAAALLLPMIAIVSLGMGLGILVGRPRMGLFALAGVASFAAFVGAIRLLSIWLG
jgi:hypothetical protein